MPVKSNRLIQGGFTALGIVVFVLVWALISHGQHEYVLPSPMATVQATSQLVTDGQFWAALQLTAMRAGLGLLIGLLLGATWGAALGKWPNFDAFCRPLVQTLLATPAVIFVILALVWFGSSTQAVVLVVGLVSTPIMLKTTAQAVRNLDTSLLEMAKVFGLSRLERIGKIITPLIAPPYLAAATVAMGQSLRVAVMAELLATATGLGGAIRLAQLNIETPQVFGYALILAAVAFCLEQAIAAPLQRRMRVPTQTV